MRTFSVLLLAAACAAAATAKPTTRFHTTFVSHVTLGVHEAPEDSWISSAPTWRVVGADMNPIVTNPLARSRYEALADADTDQESPWALWIHAGPEATRIPVAPHAAFAPEGGPPQFHLEFMIRMRPEVTALELRHGETSVHTWERPRQPPPEPDLRAELRIPANNRPARIALSWEPPPPGTWVQLMTLVDRGHARLDRRGWREVSLTPGQYEAHQLVPGGRLHAEFTVTDGFHCVAQRAHTRP